MFFFFCWIVGFKDLSESSISVFWEKRRSDSLNWENIRRMKGFAYDSAHSSVASLQNNPTVKSEGVSLYLPQFIMFFC